MVQEVGGILDPSPFTPIGFGGYVSYFPPWSVKECGERYAEYGCTDIIDLYITEDCTDYADSEAKGTNQ